MPIVLAALPTVAIGIMALLLIFGVVLLIDLLLRSIDLSKVPGFLGDILKLIASGLHTAVNAVVGFLASVAHGALSIFTAPATGFAAFVNMSALGFARLGSWVKWLVRTEVPNLWTGLFSSIASAVNNLVGLANRLYAQAIAWTNAVQSYLERLISSVASSVTAYALSLYRAAMASLSLGLANAVAYALGLHQLSLAQLAATAANLANYALALRNQAVDYATQMGQWAVATAIGASEDWAKKYADQLIDLYNRAIGLTAAGAMAPTWPVALDAIDSISLALPESIAATLARIGAIPRAIPRELALDVAAIAAVGAVAIDWVARCGVGLCRNAKGFGDDLAALEDAALLAAVFDLAFEAVTNPRGAAQAIHDDMVEPLSAISREFTRLVGIGR